MNCKFPKCSRESYLKELCRRHYSRFIKKIPTVKEQQIIDGYEKGFTVRGAAQKAGVQTGRARQVLSKWGYAVPPARRYDKSRRFGNNGSDGEF